MDNSLFPLIDKVEKLRSCDNRIGQLIDRFGYIERPTNQPLFEALTESIVSQQVSVSACATIMSKLRSASGGITPEHLSSMSAGSLRECGISERKAGWILASAQRFATGEFDSQRLATMGDDEVIAHLTELDGVGVWTAEMMLIFSLGRENVLSEKDLVLGRALKTLYGIKRLTPRRWAYFRSLFGPYCTLASFYLWAYGNSLPKQSPEIVVRRINTKQLKNKILHYSFIESRYGTLLAASAAGGLCWLAFADNRDQALDRLKSEFRRANDFAESSDRHIADTKRVLSGKRCDRLTLALLGTPFELKVWRELLHIPRGLTVSYSEIAARAGLGQAFRAVGNAVGANPVAIIIPCHRVIRADGDVGEFNAGVDKKLMLLESEK